MQPYPHTYRVTANGSAVGPVQVASAKLPTLETAPPPEFDGPGDVWSPESLLVAAVADCFLLTFRGVARAANFSWDRLECRVEGLLERIDRTPQFTRFLTGATLTIKPGVDHHKAMELMERAEKLCLIANSLRGVRLLQTNVVEQD